MFGIAPAAFNLPGLAGAGALGSGAAAGAGAAGGLAGLGAALGGPIGWAGLGLSALGSVGNLFGGHAAADRAQQQMEDQFVTNLGMSFLGPDLAQRRDAMRARDELAVAGSLPARQIEARDFRKELAGKYADPFTRAFAGRMSGATTA